jgi:hypothetical protein
VLRLATAALIGGAIAAVAGCGGDSPDRGVLRHSGAWYRSRPVSSRTHVAQACRVQVAATAGRGTAREQLRSIHVSELRAALDDAETIIARQRRPLAAVCRDVVPFHTPGLRVRFGGGARDGGDGSWTVEAISTRPYAIRGVMDPARVGARISARRMDGYTVRAAARADGSFVLPVRFRHVADNTFTVTVSAPPAAVHKLLFMALCTDCLAGTPSRPPS